MTELNRCIVYELSSSLNNFDFALENCLFGAVRLTKNADTDKYKCLVYGIEFDARGFFLFLDGSIAQNVIIFVLISVLLYMLITRQKNILVLGKGITQGLGNTTIYAEKKIN